MSDLQRTDRQASDENHKLSQQQNRAIIRHEWFDKILYALIAFFAFEIWQGVKENNYITNEIRGEIRDMENDLLHYEKRTVELEDAVKSLEDLKADVRAMRTEFKLLKEYIEK